MSIQKRKFNYTAKESFSAKEVEELLNQQDTFINNGIAEEMQEVRTKLSNAEANASKSAKETDEWKNKHTELEYNAVKLPKLSNLFIKAGGKQEGASRFIKEHINKINELGDDEKKINEYITTARADKENSIFFNSDPKNINQKVNNSLNTEGNKDNSKQRIKGTIYRA